MPDVVQSCMMPKGNENIAKPNDVQPCVQSKGNNNMLSLTSCDSVCCPRVKMDAMFDNV